MFKKVVISAGLLVAIHALPVRAQEDGKLALNVGGGVSTPLNPTAQYVGISGNFDFGAGYNIDKHNAIIGEFMWSGLPPNFTVVTPVNAPYGKVNLYTLTANYRHRFDNIAGSRFGLYLIAGGGWYYRYASVDKDYAVPAYAPCLPVYDWWGYSCGGVYTATIARKGVSSAGVNGGGGFTIRLGDSGIRFYLESRYHYAFHQIPTTLVPVTFGFRLN